MKSDKRKLIDILNEFRKEFNNWLANFFKPQLLFYVINNNTIIAHPDNYELIKLKFTITDEYELHDDFRSYNPKFKFGNYL